jgi:hypothetical protein
MRPIAKIKAKAEWLSSVQETGYPPLEMPKNHDVTGFEWQGLRKSQALHSMKLADQVWAIAYPWIIPGYRYER